jgi:hypothetical protein
MMLEHRVALLAPSTTQNVGPRRDLSYEGRPETQGLEISVFDDDDLPQMA